MKQLANILTLSISLPGRASHVKGRYFYYEQAGSVEEPELKGRIVLAGTSFRNILLPGKKGKKGKKVYLIITVLTQKQTRKHTIK